MTQDELKAAKKLLIGFAELYRDTLTLPQLEIYVRVLGGLSIEEFENALGLCVTDPQIVRMPLPAVILEKARPTTSALDAANELVGRCITAAARFGWCDPDGARKYLGETVWKALPGNRGWYDFCTAGDSQIGVPIATARAQLRDRLVNHVRRENPNGRIALPPPGEVPFRTTVYLPEDTLPSDELRRELLSEQLKLVQGDKPSE